MTTNFLFDYFPWITSFEPRNLGNADCRKANPNFHCTVVIAINFIWHLFYVRYYCETFIFLSQKYSTKLSSLQKQKF